MLPFYQNCQAALQGCLGWSKCVLQKLNVAKYWLFERKNFTLLVAVHTNETWEPTRTRTARGSSTRTLIIGFSPAIQVEHRSIMVETIKISTQITPKHFEYMNYQEIPTLKKIIQN